MTTFDFTSSSCNVQFQLSSCVSSEWADGALLVASDMLGEEPTGRGLDSIQPLGIYARPADPDSDGKGAGGLQGFQGDDGFMLPTTDPRTIGRVPQGPPGSTVLYGSGKDVTSYHYIDGETGYHQILVKYGDKSLSITLDTSSEGSENINIRHGEGQGICMTADGKLIMNSPNGQNYIELSDDGIVMQGAVKMIGGVALGGDAGVAPALSTELEALKTEISIKLVAGLDVVGVKATLPTGLVTPTPGATNAKVT